MIICLILAILFLVLSIFLFNGKGAFLIAGYNTMSKEKKNNFDEKKLCKATGFICLIVSIMLIFITILLYLVKLGFLQEDSISTPIFISQVVLILSIIIVIAYMNTKKKK